MLGSEIRDQNQKSVFIPEKGEGEKMRAMTLSEAIGLYQPNALVIDNMSELLTKYGFTSLDECYCNQIDVDWETDTMTVRLEGNVIVESESENGNLDPDVKRWSENIYANWLAEEPDTDRKSNILHRCMCRYQRDKQNLVEYNIETQFLTRYLDEKLERSEKLKKVPFISREMHEAIVSELINIVIAEMFSKGMIG